MLVMAWSPVRRSNAGRVEVKLPGDYATSNSNHPPTAPKCIVQRLDVRKLNCHLPPPPEVRVFLRSVPRRITHDRVARFGLDLRCERSVSVGAGREPGSCPAGDFAPLAGLRW